MKYLTRTMKFRNPISAFETCFNKGCLEHCWNWKAGKSSGGYGSYSVNGKTEKAHRVSYRLYVGPIPEGMIVCHRCDNPSCVNPSHLFVGTQKDNVVDSVKKGRAKRAFGISHPRAKLTESMVLKARLKYSTGLYSLREIGDLFGVGIPTINGAIHGKTWRHVQGSLPV